VCWFVQQEEAKGVSRKNRNEASFGLSVKDFLLAVCGGGSWVLKAACDKFRKRLATPDGKRSSKGAPKHYDGGPF